RFLFIPGYAPPNGGPDEVLRVATNKLHVINEVTTPAEARESVVKMAARGITALKMWVDDRRGTEPKLTPEVVTGIADDAHQHGMIIHARATTVPDQKEVLRAGVDVGVHVVQGQKIDDELAELIRQKKPYWATVITLGDSTSICQ